MRRFQPDDLVAYLQAVDRHLDDDFELLVIGGSAAALAYGVTRTTKDIDTWRGDFSAISEALEAARDETGLQIPVERPGVQDGPWSFEDRLRVAPIDGLQRLTVKVPERHDLVLMKAVRGEEPDLEVAEEIHRRQGLDFETLVMRFQTEMKHVTGEPRRLERNFLGVIDRVFGEAALRAAQSRLVRRDRDHRG